MPPIPDFTRDDGLVRGVLTIQDKNGNAFDQGITQFKWDPTVGLATEVVGVPTAAGGLTPEEKTQLQQVWTWVQSSLTNAQGLVRDLPLGVLQKIPTLAELTFESLTRTLTGRGVIQVPQLNLRRLAYGFQAITDFVPEGFGIREGFIDQYQTRVAQFAWGWSLEITGTGQFTEIVDFRFKTRTFLFEEGTEVQFLAYDVTPGAQVTVRFLTWGIP